MAWGLELSALGAYSAAVMHRHGGIQTNGQDVYVTVVAGQGAWNQAPDLWFIACASSIKGKPLPYTLAVFGEVGLSGEIRPVPNG